MARNFAIILATDTLSGALVPMLQNAMETLIAHTWRTDGERNFALTLFTLIYVSSVTTGWGLVAVFDPLTSRSYALPLGQTNKH